MTDLHTPRAILAITIAAAVSCASFPLEAGTDEQFPSPVSGPGVEAIKKSQRKKIQRGWEEVIAGDLRAGRKRVARLGRLVPAQLLEYQIRLTEGGEDITDDLAAFCQEKPDYAAAWVTLSIAAERAGSELVALRAARRAGELWTASPWGDRAADLEQRWIRDRIEEAERLFGTGDLAAAMTELDAVRALDPQNRQPILLTAKIALANDQIDRAVELLSELPDDPDARFLEGKIAESRQNWQSAMDSYSSLPEDYPERGSALQRAQIRWRLTLLPNYARQSMESDRITRGDLAVILVSIQPRLETLQGGPVPVMSDIVDYPGQREIITVVRLGIMNADRRGHLFYPDGEAALETIRGAIQRSRSLLGLPAPVWCEKSDVVGSACISMPSPTSGGSIVEAVLDVVSGAGS